MVTAGARIAGSAESVIRAGSTEIELDEFGAIRIPLKHHPFCPIMPNRCCEDDILIDRDVALGSRASGGRKPMASDLTVFTEVGLREIDRALAIEGFMHRQTTWIGMMAAKIAAGRGGETKWQQGASRAVIDHRREDTRFDAACDRPCIRRIYQSLRLKSRHNLVL